MFYGSRINHLPAPLFVLFHRIAQEYGKPGRCSERLSGTTLIFDEEKSVYYDSRNPDEIILTPANAVLSVSRFRDPLNGEYVFFLGLDGNDLHMDMPCGINHIVIPANPSLDRVYRTLKSFRASNRNKYMLPSSAAVRARQAEQEAADPLRDPAADRKLTGRLPACDCMDEWKKIAVFDTEMLFVYPTQFAGILLEKRGTEYVRTGALDMYIRLPKGKKLTKNVKRVTGQTDEMLEALGICEEEALRKIAVFLKEADIVCGQAVNGDIEMLRQRYYHADAPDIQEPPVLRRQRIIDTEVMLQGVFELDNPTSLEKAADIAGIQCPADPFHDARTDADVTAELFCRLLPAYQKKFGSAPVIDPAILHHANNLQLLRGLGNIHDPGKKGKHGKRHGQGYE